jgi:sec-independent protein translocase protein TatA
MYEKKRIFARVITKNSEIMTNLLLFGLGLQEIVVIALIVLLLFGGKKIPELMKGLGKGVKSFKDGMKEIDTDDKENKEKSE